MDYVESCFLALVEGYTEIQVQFSNKGGIVRVFSIVYKSAVCKPAIQVGSYVNGHHTVQNHSY